MIVGGAKAICRLRKTRKNSDSFGLAETGFDKIGAAKCKNLS